MERTGDAPTTGAATLRVSTDAMPARHRVGLWREEFARKFLRLDIEPRDPEHFRADATIWMMPGLKMSSSVVSASTWRRPRGMDDSGAEELCVVSGRHGPAMLSQRARSFELGVGDAATCLHSEPADLDLPQTGRYVSLVVPIVPVAGLLRGGEATPRHIPHNNEPLRLLWSYLRSLEDSVTLASPELRQAFATHVHDLIALALGTSRDGTEIATRRGLRAARLRAVKADVRANLASADLSVATVAHRQGITPRYLHMLFEDEGTTFSRFVLAERLAAAHWLLVDARHDHQTIAAIAYESGFGDLSYFNRAFRRRFGMTPGEARMESGGIGRAAGQGHHDSQ
jgi:AraC-like DNA-binding protein